MLNSSGQVCADTCCTNGSWGPMSRIDTHFFNVTVGWMLAVLVHGFMSRSRFMCEYSSQMMHLIKHAHVPALWFIIVWVYSLMMLVTIALPTILHASCEWDGNFYIAETQILYKLSTSAWTSVVHLRVARLCSVIRECHERRTRIDYKLLQSERVMLVLALISPIVYVAVHYMTAHNMAARWLGFSAQLALESLIALCILLVVLPLLLELDFQQSDAPLRPSEEAHRWVQRLTTIWAGCALSVLPGFITFALDLANKHADPGNNLPTTFFNLLELARIYLLLHVLAPLGVTASNMQVAIVDSPQSSRLLADMSSMRSKASSSLDMRSVRRKSANTQDRIPTEVLASPIDGLGHAGRSAIDRSPEGI